MTALSGGAAPGGALAPASATPQAQDAPGDRLLEALRADGAAQTAALREVHLLMLRAARHQVWRMGAMLPGVGSVVREEIACAAADDALTALLGKLDTFEGRSRFTTWAYKFAILQAATEVRRLAWAQREVPLEDTGTWWATEAGPEDYAEASDLARAVTRALDHALTDYQRRIAVALLVDEVPIDVLAERLGTTRGALYKTLHVARGRIRAHLAAGGHLPAPAAPAEENHR